MLIDIDKKIIKGGVPGFYSIYDAILIIDQPDKVWGAFLNGEVVYYFTTEKEDKNKLSVTTEEWITNFKKKEIIYLDTE